MTTEEEKALQERVMKELQRILITLQESTPLPTTSSLQTAEAFAAWHAAFKQIEDHVHAAEVIALLTCPESIRKILGGIKARKHTLLTCEESDPCDLCHKPTGTFAEQRTGMSHETIVPYAMPVYCAACQADLRAFDADMSDLEQIRREWQAYRNQGVGNGG
jgi:hypothetical protein